MRILNDTGILVSRTPARSIIDYKLMLDQVFTNTYIMQITLETRKMPWANESLEHMNHEILYLYSKTNEYSLNKIYWVRPFWVKLESESKQFLPTAELLYQQYKETKQFDLFIATGQTAGTVLFV